MSGRSFFRLGRVSRTMSDDEPAYAAGFRTQDSEVREVALDVEGDLPDWLSGTLVRNGPARFEAGDRRLNHWFDGYAMLHAFAIDGASDTVTYANRSLDSAAHRHVEEEDELGYAEFATDPCRDLFERFFAIFDPDVTDNANVNVTRLADRYVAMTETPMPIEFDPETLETVGVREETVPDGHVTTAHPHYDPERGAAINYVTRLRPFGHRYRVYALPEGADGGEGAEAMRAGTGAEAKTDGGAARAAESPAAGSAMEATTAASGPEPEVLAEVPVDKPRYMHSFGMTERYVVLAEFPLTVSLWNLALSGGGPFIEAYDWEPERGTRFTVIDKDTGDVVARPTGEPFFAFHHVNAFERDRPDGGREVVVDVCAYDDAGIVDALYLDELLSPEGHVPGSELRRYRVPLDDEGAVASEVLYPGTVELPRINYPRCNAGDYRYVYGGGSRTEPPEDFIDRLVKVDVETGEAAVWEEDGAYPGEPVFVASPDADHDDEDAGVVLSVVLDADTETSFLLCLDAGSFEERARAAVPQAVPFGFHGQFWR